MREDKLLPVLVAVSTAGAIVDTALPVLGLSTQLLVHDPHGPVLTVARILVLAFGFPQLVLLLLYLRPRRRQARELRETRRRVDQVLAEQRIDTAFQPMVDLASGQVVAVEALTRFTTDPPRTPDAWFGDATRAGLGLELELLAARTAIANAGQLPAHLTVAVNVSPATVATDEFLDLILRSGIDPERVVVEITEHTEVQDYPALLAATDRLAGHGIRVAVDDTGAGYASLQHIVKLAPHIIKIDRELIAGLDGDASRWGVVAAIVHFATATNTRLVAEGVETEAELQALRRVGVHYGQGYHLGRPTTDRGAWQNWVQHFAIATLGACY